MQPFNCMQEATDLTETVCSVTQVLPMLLGMWAATGLYQTQACQQQWGDAGSLESRLLLQHSLTHCQQLCRAQRICRSDAAAAASAVHPLLRGRRHAARLICAASSGTVSSVGVKARQHAAEPAATAAAAAAHDM